MSTAMIVHRVGMSTRPEYYSGYGANDGDLSASRLRRIREEISSHFGTEASEAFSEMVLHLSTLAPTVFLQSLYELEARGWTVAADLPQPSNVYVEPRGKTTEQLAAVVFGTLTALQAGSRRNRREDDETTTRRIKFEFFYGDTKRTKELGSLSNPYHNPYHQYYRYR